MKRLHGDGGGGDGGDSNNMVMMLMMMIQNVSITATALSDLQE